MARHTNSLPRWLIDGIEGREARFYHRRPFHLAPIPRVILESLFCLTPHLRPRHECPTCHQRRSSNQRVRRTSDSARRGHSSHFRKRRLQRFPSTSRNRSLGCHHSSILSLEFAITGTCQTIFRSFRSYFLNLQGKVLLSPLGHEIFACYVVGSLKVCSQALQSL